MFFYFKSILISISYILCNSFDYIHLLLANLFALEMVMVVTMPTLRKLLVLLLCPLFLINNSINGRRIATWPRLNPVSAAGVVLQRPRCLPLAIPCCLPLTWPYYHYLSRHHPHTWVVFELPAGSASLDPKGPQIMAENAPRGGSHAGYCSHRINHGFVYLLAL